MRKRNKLLGFVFLGFVFAASGCDAVYSLLQKEGAQEKAVLGEVDPLVENDEVEEVQKLLKLYGYSIGAADGKMGANTRDALEKFQTEQGLKPTRFVDKATWSALHSFAECGLVDEGEIDIHTLQQALLSAGFNPGKVDGQFGPQTKKAIKEFQRAHKLAPDGLIGIQTLKALAEYLPSPRK
jgi:peptidoglycan hydrolase-like protein with peptidoglycan-binding domain